MSYNPSRKNELTIAQITRAAGVVMASFVLTGVLGVVRQSIIGARFGAGVDTDAFFAANRVSETLFTLVSGGALGSAFIPVFSRFLGREDTAGAWRLASAVVTLVTVTATILAVIAGILAEPIVTRLLSPQASADQQLLTVELMRIMLGTVVIFSVSGLSMAILNTHQQFLVASLAPSMYNIGLIIGALAISPILRAPNQVFGLAIGSVSLVRPSTEIFGLAIGAVLGALLHLMIQLPSLRRLKGRFRPTMDLNSPGVIEVLRLMGPRVLGLGVVQINFWVNAALTSGMESGSLTALSFAFALLFTVLGVLGQSVGTAVFPTLSALMSHDDAEGFRRVLASAMRGVLFMALPATVGLIVLAVPLVNVIFRRGDWTTHATDLTAWALQLYAIGLAGFALQEVLARAFYALRDTWTPVLVGVLGVILNIILSLILINVMRVGIGAGPVGGLALANALATLIESAALWLFMRRRIKSILDREVISAAGRTAIAALLMGVVVYAMSRLLNGLPSLIVLGAGALIGVLVFEGLALAFGLDEARSVPRALLSRFRR